MRNAFAEALYQEALRDERIYIVCADISPVGSMQKFREEFPERFINVGVAEQSMISICAGLALKGKRPFAYTIANFALYRPFEFVRNDLCYQNLPVVVVGMGAGLSYPDHGGTHHTIEDVAIACAIPNMQVLAPCDPFETKAAVEWCARENQGPVYLRLGKSGEPNLGPATHEEPWRFGKLRQLTPARGEQVVLSYGPIAKLAVELAGRLPRATTFSCATLKPFLSEDILNLLVRAEFVVVVEEHVSRGGLFDQCERLAWAWRLRNPAGITGFVLKDEFVHCNGKRDDMLKAHELDLETILHQLGY